METKDILTLSLGLMGWLWAILQFIITRRNQKLDKILEKRLEVYAGFMNKMDEMNQNMRNDPNMIYGISSNFLESILDKSDDEINKALIDFNSKLLEQTKKAIQPMMIINQELNKLKLVCSKELLAKIQQYKDISSDYSEDFQSVLSELSSSNDINLSARKLQNLGHNERGRQLANLWPEIESMMRDEIGYYKK